jgi:ACR3 family arsenite transporter
MLFVFAPIARFLVSGASSRGVRSRALLDSVIVFIAIPPARGVLVLRWLIGRHRRDWFEQQFLLRFAPVSMVALLATRMLIFAFEVDNTTGKFLRVPLIAFPMPIRVSFNSSLTYGLMRLFGVPCSVAAPWALIGASNFFEPAVATAIALFGPGSGAALANRGGRADRGAGHALGLPGLQPDTTVVPEGFLVEPFDRGLLPGYRPLWRPGAAGSARNLSGLE